MNLTRKVYETRNEKVIDFLIGFFGWFILNAIFYGFQAFFAGGVIGLGEATNLSQDMINILTWIIGCLPFLINIGLLIFLGLTRYWIALGGLAAFAAILLLVILLFIFLLIACFVFGNSYSYL